MERAAAKKAERERQDLLERELAAEAYVLMHNSCDRQC